MTAGNELGFVRNFRPLQESGHDITPTEQHAADLLTELREKAEGRLSGKKPIILSTPNDAVRRYAVNATLHAALPLLQAGQVLVVEDRPETTIENIPIPNISWKNDIVTEFHKRPNRLILVNNDEPLSTPQLDVLRTLAEKIHVIAFETHSKIPLPHAIDRGLLRPINHTAITTSISSGNLLAFEWFKSGTVINNHVLERIARDQQVIEDIVKDVLTTAVLSAPDQTVTNLKRCFVQATDTDQAQMLAEKIRAGLPAELTSRVAVIQKAAKLNEDDQRVIAAWKQGKIDILIATTIPSHIRPPKELNAVFVQPDDTEAWEELLLRALQYTPGSTTDPLLVHEITPCANPRERGYHTVAEAFGKKKPEQKVEGVPAPQKAPSEPTLPPAEPTPPPTANRPETMSRKPRATKPLDLMRRRGINLRSLGEEKLLAKRPHLSLKSQEVLDLAMKRMNVHEAAKQLDIAEPAVRQRVVYLLFTIDLMERNAKKSRGRPPTKVIYNL